MLVLLEAARARASSEGPLAILSATWLRRAKSGGVDGLAQAVEVTR